MKKTVCIALGILGMTALFAEEQKFNSAEQFEKNPGLKCTPEVNRITGAHRLLGKEYIAVDPEAVYTLKITARKVPGSPEFYAHVGFLLYDEAMVELKPYFYRAEYNTDTVLLAPAVKGSRTVKIRKPSWFPADLVRRGWYLAFDTKADKSDIPNRNVNAVAKFEAGENGEVTLTLRTPVAKDYQANTKVRFQSNAAAGMYALLNGVKLTDEFQTCTVKIKCMDKGMSAKRFWKGAAFVRPVISNSPATSDRKIVFEFKDFSINME